MSGDSAGAAVAAHGTATSGLGLFRVATALGTVVAAHDQPLASGQPITVSVRPEAVHFDAAGPYRGTVQSAYFLGSTVEHTLACAGGQTVLVQTAPAQRRAVGETVAFDFEPGHAWAIVGAASSGASASTSASTMTTPLTSASSASSTGSPTATGPQALSTP